MAARAQHSNSQATTVQSLLALGASLVMQPNTAASLLILRKKMQAILCIMAMVAYSLQILAKAARRRRASGLEL